MYDPEVVIISEEEQIGPAKPPIEAVIFGKTVVRLDTQVRGWENDILVINNPALPTEGETQTQRPPSDS